MAEVGWVGKHWHPGECRNNQVRCYNATKEDVKLEGTSSGWNSGVLAQEVY